MGGDADTLKYLSRSLEEGVPALILKEKKNKEGANVLANALEGFSEKKLKDIREVSEVDNDKQMKLKEEMGKIINPKKKAETEKAQVEIEEQPEHQIFVEEGLKCLKTKTYVRNFYLDKNNQIQLIFVFISAI